MCLRLFLCYGKRVASWCTRCIKMCWIVGLYHFVLQTTVVGFNHGINFGQNIKYYCGTRLFFFNLFYVRFFHSEQFQLLISVNDSYFYFLIIFVFELGSWRARYKSWSSKLRQCNDKTLLSRCMFSLCPSC